MTSLLHHVFFEPRVFFDAWVFNKYRFRNVFAVIKNLFSKWFDFQFLICVFFKKIIKFCRVIVLMVHIIILNICIWIYNNLFLIVYLYCFIRILTCSHRRLIRFIITFAENIINSVLLLLFHIIPHIFKFLII